MCFCVIEIIESLKIASADDRFVGDIWLLGADFKINCEMTADQVVHVAFVEPFQDLHHGC